MLPVALEVASGLVGKDTDTGLADFVAENLRKAR